MPTFRPPGLAIEASFPSLGTRTEMTMGMILSLPAVSDATIERLHAYPTLVWQIIAPDDPKPPVPRGTSAPGWLAWIYPEIRDRNPAEDDALGNLMEYLAELRRAVKTASDQGMGLLITFT